MLQVYRHSRQRGFTLIELITVIVILGLVASVGSRFVVTSLKSYRDAQARQQLSQQTWNSMEQVSRRIRNAFMDQVRVSDDNKCLFIQEAGFCMIGQQLVYTAANHTVGESVVAEIENTASSFTYVGSSPISPPAIHIRIRFKHHQYGLDIDRKVFIRNDRS